MLPVGHLMTAVCSAGICAEHFLDTPAIGLLELMPLTTDGNATIDLDEPGTFHFADPLYCGAPHHMIVEVSLIISPARNASEAPQRKVTIGRKRFLPMVWLQLHIIMASEGPL